MKKLLLALLSLPVYAGTVTTLVKNESGVCSQDVNFTSASVGGESILTTSDIGTIASQAANNVAITGGAIDGVTIGGVTPGAVTATTTTATTFDTGVLAAGVTMSGTTISADGTDSNINIAITPKGTGEVDIAKVDIDGGAIDGTTIGAVTPAAGYFSAASIGGESALTTSDWAAPGAIGATTPAAGAFTTATANAFIPNSATVPANGVYLPAANSVGIATDTAERLRIDASGNLGLGVVPSAWDTSSFKALEFSNGNALYTNGSQMSLGSNAHNDGAGWKYKTTNAAGLSTNVQGVFTWYTAPGGTAGNAITFTQAMTLAASGNLLIGTTTEASPTAARCVIQGATSGSDSLILALKGSDTNTKFSVMGNGAVSINSTIDAGTSLFSVVSGADAARDVAIFGVTGVTNGYQIQYTGSEMAYSFNDGKLFIGAADTNLYRSAAYVLKTDDNIEHKGTYGEIYVADGSTAQTISTGASYTKLTPFTAEADYSDCTPSHANDQITLTRAGKYMVVINWSGAVSLANSSWDFAVFKNSTEQSQIHASRKFSATDIGSLTLAGIVSVAANDVLTLQVAHDNGGSLDITTHDCGFSVHYLGY